MSARSHRKDIEKLLRQEREYTNCQVEQIRQDFEQRLGGQTSVAEGLKNVLARKQQQDSAAVPAISNVKTQNSPKARMLLAAADPSHIRNMKTKGHSGILTYGAQVIEIPDDLLHLDWRQARMGGNWKAIKGEVMLMPELFFVRPFGVGEEVIDESQFEQVGWGEHSDSPQSPRSKNRGLIRKVPTKEKVTIQQIDERCRGNPWKDKRVGQRSSSLKEDYNLYRARVNAINAESEEETTALEEESEAETVETVLLNSSDPLPATREVMSRKRPTKEKIRFKESVDRVKHNRSRTQLAPHSISFD